MCGLRLLELACAEVRNTELAVCIASGRVAFDRFVEGFLRRRDITVRAVHHAAGHPCGRARVIERQRAIGGLTRQCQVIRAFRQLEQPHARLGKPGMRRGIPRIGIDGPVEQVDRTLEAALLIDLFERTARLLVRRLPEGLGEERARGWHRAGRPTPPPRIVGPELQIEERREGLDNRLRGEACCAEPACVAAQLPDRRGVRNADGDQTIAARVVHADGDRQVRAKSPSGGARRAGARVEHLGRGDDNQAFAEPLQLREPASHVLLQTGATRLDWLRSGRPRQAEPPGASRQAGEKATYRPVH